MGVAAVTFGCRLNAVEADAMRAQAEAAGPPDRPIVNTCAVTAEAAKQARQAIRKLARERPDDAIVVTGCAAQIDPETFAAMPEVSRVLGNAGKLKAETWTADFSRGGGAKVQVSDIMAEREPATHRILGMRGRTRVFIPVQNGCDHRCTFCVIPFGRGNSRSVPARLVVEQVASLVDHGTREVVLTGVDLTSYGRDRGDRATLGSLVRLLLREIPALDRLRLSSIDSIEAGPSLMAALAEEPRLMPHLHLSLQSGDDLILKRMKRRHTSADAVRFCREVLRLRPDMIFGADLIAGFPTETDAMFSRSLDLVEECGLTHLHVFPYSARPGTPASRMPAVAPEVIRDRARQLRLKGEDALRRHLGRIVGRTPLVLTERNGLARTEQFTPVVVGPETPAGLLIEAKITGHDGARRLAA